MLNHSHPSRKQLGIFVVSAYITNSILVKAENDSFAMRCLKMNHTMIFRVGALIDD